MVVLEAEHTQVKQDMQEMEEAMVQTEEIIQQEH